ncbi:hypothetical protein [Dietzia sp. UBA5065]|jgi:hypothetical protein|uniref:hypothetical protein n=1 Tax=Dietzia sp. UBA5065 TaxID=1946422 RepID=UPI0025B7F055|nr:hypothetical protein [Dietzia sp. UBA5065]HMT49465.1 hypothetical protein [Dietzia sp.]
MALNELSDRIVGGLQATAIGAALGVTVGTAPIPEAGRDVVQDGTPVASMIDFAADSRDGAEALAQAIADGELDDPVSEVDYGDHGDPPDDADASDLDDFIGEVDTWDDGESDLDDLEYGGELDDSCADVDTDDY